MPDPQFAMRGLSIHEVDDARVYYSVNEHSLMFGVLIVATVVDGVPEFLCDDGSFSPDPDKAGAELLGRVRYDGTIDLYGIGSMRFNGLEEARKLWSVIEAVYALAEKHLKNWLP